MVDRRAGSRLVVREVMEVGDPAIRAGYQLLKRFFPPTELSPMRDWLDYMRERSRDLWLDLNWHVIVAERNRQVVGVGTGLYIGSANIGLIGYIAAQPALRGRGIGTRVRAGLRRALERDARRIRGRPLEALMGEVSVTNPWLRRLVREQGVIALDFPYYQPPIQRHGAPVPFVLYYEPLRARRRTLPAAEVKRLLFALWRRPYRVARPLKSPLFRRMLRSIERRDRIGQRRLPEPVGDRRSVRE